RTTSNFKPQLRQLTNTLERITPIINDVRNHNLKLDRTRSEQDMLIKEIEEAKNLVEKCSRIKWNFILKFTHSLKLKDVSQKLQSFFQADQWRDIKKVLVEVDSVNERLISLSINMSSRRCGTAERRRFGWRVPPLPRGIVGFDEALNRLKAKILEDINIHDDGSEMDCDDGSVYKVVVVSGVGGDGKTTLVKMLCNDPQIQEIFGENVFFVTVSEEFNYKAKFQSTEDAKNELENFLREKVSGPILLVLDDVWSELDIKNFQFDIKGYKLLVTSRMVFTKYDMFKFDPLSDEDAKILFRRSARPIHTIDENLVDQMVKFCKKHPLTLSVVGGHSVLDNKEILNRLERSFETLEAKFKQCYLDFGLFLEDQRIPASAILDMWVHWYNHDDEGIDTLSKIFELSYRNLVNVVTRRPREDPYETVSYCEQQFVTQHDLLRQLAINLSSKLPVSERPRLIISEQNDRLVTHVLGEDQVASVELQEPMQARILSISTDFIEIIGESFSSRWCNMRVPKVEVMVLNLKSKTYTLPHFLKEMQNLMILNVTNYGLYPTEFKNFHLLCCLSNLTRIRLERVAISSFSRSTLALVNLQKVSFIMCKMRNAFEDIDNLNIWPRLIEIEMDYCQDLVIYPQILCSASSVYLKKLSITNCNELREISEKVGNLTSLEILNLHSCTQLEKLPESVTMLQNLSILDISDCLSLTNLPEQMGSLGGLRTIYMSGFTGVHELPLSVKDKTKVVCNEEVACQWKEFRNVEINVVEEDRTATLERIIC
ncbi:hypothetical protein M8C21_010230, partial [Ambrosia artemisiifolia]